MCVGDVGQDISTQARPASIFELRPSKAYWSALKDQEEKVDSAEKHDDPEVDVDDAYLILLTRETEEVDANGELRDGGGEHVEKFANENVLDIVS